MWLVKQVGKQNRPFPDAVCIILLKCRGKLYEPVAVKATIIRFKSDGYLDEACIYLRQTLRLCYR